MDGVLGIAFIRAFQTAARVCGLADCQPPLRPVLALGNLLLRGRQQIDLVQVAGTAHVHDGALELLVALVRGVVLAARPPLALVRHPLANGLVEAPDAAERDVGVDVARAIVALRMREHDADMAAKPVVGEAHGHRVGLLHREPDLGVARVEAEDVVVRLHVAGKAVLAVGLVDGSRCERVRERLTVDAVH